MKTETRNLLRDKILYRCPKLLAHSYLYWRSHGKRMDFKNPVTYDEKIHWLMVYKYDKSYAGYADKIAVRDFVKEAGLGDLLVPLAGRGVYSSADEIDFDELPEKYILMANHGSGDAYYFICNGSQPVDREAVVAKLNKALATNFAEHCCQYHYGGIKPAIMCESFLEVEGHDRLTDYKLVCSYGKVIAVLVCKDRNEGRDYYSTDWRYLDYVRPEYRSGAVEEKPPVLEKMLSAASILSRTFPLARVDFYVVNNKLYFGEITLTPAEGINRYLNEKGQLAIGKAISLSE